MYDAATQHSAPFSFSGQPPAAVESFAWTSPTQLVAAGFAQRPRRSSDNAVLLSCNLFLGTATPLKDSSGVVLKGRDISAAAGKLVFDDYTDRYREGYSVHVTVNLRLLDLASGAVQTIASHKELEGYGFDFQEPLLSPDGSAVMFSSTGTDVSVTYEVMGTTAASSWRPNSCSSRAASRGTPPAPHRSRSPAAARRTVPRSSSGSTPPPAEDPR